MKLPVDFLVRLLTMITHVCVYIYIYIYITKQINGVAFCTVHTD